MSDPDPVTLKACCTDFYQSDLVRLFLGDSFHPGGDEMTRRLGAALGLTEDSHVLDVACGAGASTIALAREFGCTVTGVDLGDENLARAKERAVHLGLGKQVRFKVQDAEDLGFPEGTFDAVISECALCTFPDKGKALREMHKVLKPGGWVGITDVVVERELPDRVQGILFHVACISGALPASGYLAALEAAGFEEVSHQDQSYAMGELLDMGDRLVMGWRALEKLYRLDLEELLGIDQAEAKELLAGARQWLEDGAFGYGLFIGRRP
jgi:ubiquinone/menaquinone biosynthesis C-methylase UbiE